MLARWARRLQTACGSPPSHAALDLKELVLFGKKNTWNNGILKTYGNLKSYPFDPLPNLISTELNKFRKLINANQLFHLSEFDMEFSSNVYFTADADGS